MYNYILYTPQSQHHYLNTQLSSQSTLHENFVKLVTNEMITLS